MKVKILFPIKNGVVSQRFGENVDFYRQRFGISGGHNGVDIVSFHGDELLACEDMTAYKVFDLKTGSVTHGFGANFLTPPDEWVLKGGVCREWVYWHTMSNLQVRVGDFAPQGSVIGYEGASGAVYQNQQPVPDSKKGKPPYPGTHLHWAYREVLRTKDTSYDGAPFLQTSLAKKYQDSEGYFYKVLNHKNGHEGWLDPLANEIIQYPAWLVEKQKEKEVSEPKPEPPVVLTPEQEVWFLGQLKALWEKVLELIKGRHQFGSTTMKYSLTQGGILVAVLGTVLVNSGFSSECSNQLITNIPVLIGGLVAWIGRWRRGDLTFGGFRRMS